eukprot:8664569-Lingulodinium_polyedra.AAC.1
MPPRFWVLACARGRPGASLLADVTFGVFVCPDAALEVGVGKGRFAQGFGSFGRKQVQFVVEALEA